MPDQNSDQLRRSYKRNLGHSRFWAGVGAALLGAFLLFVSEVLWEVGKEPGSYTALTEAAFGFGLWLLGISVGTCFLLSWLFRDFYRLDDRALAEIERGNRDNQEVA